MKKASAFFLVLLLTTSFFSFIPHALAQEKTYLKVFEKDGTVLRIPTISLSDSVVSYQDTRDFYQFNVTLSKLPVSSVFDFPLETEGLEFYYQPPLNEELDLKQYAFVNATHALNEKGKVVLYRPENVVGSYAVYRSDGKTGNQYTTGKLYHIYRPLLIDAKGATSWANLSVSKISLSIICNPDFLATAIYPVTIDPSFGYTSVGGSWTGVGGEGFISGRFQLTEAGTITKLTAYLMDTDSAHNCKAGYYTDTTGPLPDALRAQDSEVSVYNAGWYEFDVPDTAESAAYFWLAIEFSISSSRIAYDSTGTCQYKTGDPYASAMSNPAPAETSGANIVISIYANYTTGGVEPYYYTCEVLETASATASFSATKLLYSSGTLTTAITLENGQIKSIYTVNTQTTQASAIATPIKALHFTLTSTITSSIIETAIKNLFTSASENAQPTTTILSVKQIFFLAQNIIASSEVVYASKTIFGMVTVTIIDAVLPSEVAYCIKSFGTTILAITILEVVSPAIALFVEYPSILAELTTEQVLVIAIALIVTFFSIAIGLTFMRKKREE